MRFNKKVAASVAAGAVVLVGSGVAYAYWTTTGAGSGNSTDNAAPGTVTETATFNASNMAPGQHVSVAYTGANSSTTSLSVGAPVATVTSDKTYQDASSATQSCADFLSLTLSTATGAVVPAGAGATSLGGSQLNYADSTTINQDSCKGQKITITLASPVGV
jgi:hypothetical protein